MLNLFVSFHNMSTTGIKDGLDNSVVVPLMSSVASLIVEKLNSLKETDFRKNNYLYINEQNSSV